MMKKTVALILALVLVLALASCGGKDKNDAVDLEPFKTAVAATSLKNANVKIVASNDFIDDPLNANYDIVYAEDGSAEINFTYELYNEISEDGPQDIKTVHVGTARVSADGTVSGDSVSETITAAASVSFNLDASKMSCSVSMGILSASIPAANTEAVLGSSIGADVVLTLSTANGVVTGATVSYSLDGVDYKITCTYNN